MLPCSDRDTTLVLHSITTENVGLPRSELPRSSSVMTSRCKQWFLFNSTSVLIDLFYVHISHNGLIIKYLYISSLYYWCRSNIHSNQPLRNLYYHRDIITRHRATQGKYEVFLDSFCVSNTTRCHSTQCYLVITLKCGCGNASLNLPGQR